MAPAWPQIEVASAAGWQAAAQLAVVAPSAAAAQDVQRLAATLAGASLFCPEAAGDQGAGVNHSTVLSAPGTEAAVATCHHECTAMDDVIMSTRMFMSSKKNMLQLCESSVSDEAMQT